MSTSLPSPSFPPSTTLNLLFNSPSFSFLFFPTSISPSSVSFPVLHLLPPLLLHLLPPPDDCPLLFSSSPFLLFISSLLFFSFSFCFSSTSSSSFLSLLFSSSLLTYSLSFPLHAHSHKAEISPEVLGDFLQCESTGSPNENQSQVDRHV